MYRFYSNPANTRRVAVVGSHENGILKIAVAICSPRDQFRRKKGRMIAEGRLKANKVYTSIPIASCDSEQFVNIASALSHEVINAKANNKIIYKHKTKQQ
jgi:hypothetical protein